MQEALTLNARLQEEGKELLEKIDLEKILGKYGQVFQVGSFVYGTMVDEDIDITVWCPGDNFDSVDLRQKVAADLLLIPELDGMDMCDREKYPSKNNSVGVWFGPRIWHNNKRWNFDIWFVRENTKGVTPEVELHKQMLNITEEQRKTILDIKYQLLKSGQKQKSVTSADVYKAVLGEDVKSYEEYKKLRQIT